MNSFSMDKPKFVWTAKIILCNNAISQCLQNFIDFSFNYLFFMSVIFILKKLAYQNMSDKLIKGSYYRL